MENQENDIIDDANQENIETTAETEESTEETTVETEESTEEIVETDETIELSDEDILNLINTESLIAESGPMPASYIALSSIHLIISIILIIVVLRQSKASSYGVSNFEGVQTYWSKNKGRSQESKLAKLTIILAVLIFIITLAISFV